MSINWFKFKKLSDQEKIDELSLQIARVLVNIDYINNKMVNLSTEMWKVEAITNDLKGKSNDN